MTDYDKLSEGDVLLSNCTDKAWLLLKKRGDKCVWLSLTDGETFEGALNGTPVLGFEVVWKGREP